MQFCRRQFVRARRDQSRQNAEEEVADGGRDSERDRSQYLQGFVRGGASGAVPLPAMAPLPFTSGRASGAEYARPRQANAADPDVEGS